MPRRDDHLPDAAARRTFLANVGWCAGGIACLGCARALAQQPAAAAAPPAASQPAGADADSRMTFKRVYDFSYTENLIPLMKAISNEMGREKLVEMLKIAASKAAADAVRKSAPPPPKNSLAALVGPEQQDYFWSHVLSMKRVESTPSAVEVRVTECLWAATFRRAEAADIGYACICNPDFAAASAFNAKIRMTRTKTLMQGHDCCNHRWVVEA